MVVGVELTICAVRVVGFISTLTLAQGRVLGFVSGLPALTGSQAMHVSSWSDEP